MKKLLLLCVVALLLAVIPFVKTYCVVRADGSGEILWRGDECFVAVGVNYFGWKLNVWQLLKELAKGVLNIPSDRGVSDTKRGTEVFRYSNGKVIRFHLHGLDSIAGFFPYHGRLYSIVGGQPRRGVEWNGSTFVELSCLEMERIESDMLASGLTEERWIQREGWNRIPAILVLREARKEYPITLRGEELRIIVSQPNSHQRTVSLSGPGSREQLLEQFDRLTRRVSRAEYASLLGRD